MKKHGKASCFVVFFVQNNSIENSNESEKEKEICASNAHKCTCWQAFFNTCLRSNSGRILRVIGLHIFDLYYRAAKRYKNKRINTKASQKPRKSNKKESVTFEVPC